MTELIQKPGSEVVATKPAAESQSQAPKMDQGPVALTIVEKTNGALSTSKATGPRTESGKKRSSQNSMKFGIFSKATLLEGESREEYQRLSNGIRESLAPVGAVEELLVEKLVTNMWRNQRMLRAEGAEIQMNSKFLQDGRGRSQLDGVGEIGRWRHTNTMSECDPEESGGLIWNSQHSDALARCIELLVDLRQSIKANGFVEGRDDELLCKIYGDPERPHLRPTLQESYAIWRETANAAEEERARTICHTQGMQADCFAGNWPGD